MRKRVEVGIPHPCFDLEIETQQLSAVGNFPLEFFRCPKDMQSCNQLTRRWKMRWCPKSTRTANTRELSQKQRRRKTVFERSSKWKHQKLPQQTEPCKRQNNNLLEHRIEQICLSSHMCSCGVSIRDLNPCWQLYKKNIRCSSDNCRNWLPPHLPVRQIGQKLWRLGKDIRLHLLHFGEMSRSMTVVFTSYCKITSSSSDDSYSFNEVSECCLNWPSFATQQQEHVEFQRGNKMTDKVGAKVWDRVRTKWETTWETSCETKSETRCETKRETK